MGVTEVGKLIKLSYNVQLNAAHFKCAFAVYASEGANHCVAAFQIEMRTHEAVVLINAHEIKRTEIVVVYHFVYYMRGVGINVSVSEESRNFCVTVLCYVFRFCAVIGENLFVFFNSESESPNF